MTDGKQPTINVRASFQKAYDKSQIKKESYIENLKAAKGDDIFKYLLLIDAEQLEGYVNQTRIQADKSFTLSRNGAIAGFMLLCGGIVLGWIFNILGRNGL
ncbi:MAG: hypothetical protein ACXAAT_20275, partial [Candidatus Hodarchaeales archaeon]